MLPQAVLQPPVNIPNIPKIPDNRQEVPQVTPRQVRKRASLLTPPATMDPANIPLPSSSASGYEQSTIKKKKWHSFSDYEDEEDEEVEKEQRGLYKFTQHLRKRLRDDKEY